MLDPVFESWYRIRSPAPNWPRRLPCFSLSPPQFSASSAYLCPSSCSKLSKCTCWPWGRHQRPTSGPAPTSTGQSRSARSVGTRAWTLSRSRFHVTSHSFAFATWSPTSALYRYSGHLWPSFVSCETFPSQFHLRIPPSIPGHSPPIPCSWHRLPPHFLS